MKNKTIEVPILNNEYKVIVCWGSPKYIREEGFAYGYDDVVVRILEDNRGTIWKNPRLHPIIALPRYPQTPVEIGTLAHEAFHGVFEIMTRIGATIDDEIVAHSVGAIVRTVLSGRTKHG